MQEGEIVGQGVTLFLKASAICRAGNLLGKILHATRDQKMRHNDQRL